MPPVKHIEVAARPTRCTRYHLSPTSPRDIKTMFSSVVTSDLSELSSEIPPLSAVDDVLKRSEDVKPLSPHFQMPSSPDKLKTSFTPSAFITPTVVNISSDCTPDSGVSSLDVLQTCVKSSQNSDSRKTSFETIKHDDSSSAMDVSQTCSVISTEAVTRKTPLSKEPEVSVMEISQNISQTDNQKSAIIITDDEGNKENTKSTNINDHKENSETGNIDDVEKKENNMSYKDCDVSAQLDLSKMSVSECTPSRLLQKSTLEISIEE